LKKSKFLPDYMFSRVWDITPEFLREHKIVSLIMDLDNTLARAHSPEAWPGVHEWLMLMESSGIRIIILSNNTEKRILSFLQNKYNYDYISMSGKPLRINFSKAVKLLRTPKKNVAMVGDQIFTDILGGNMSGIMTILVEPFEIKGEGGFFFDLKRKAESRYINKYKEGLK